MPELVAAPGIATSTSPARRVVVDQVFTAALSSPRVRVGQAAALRGTVDPFRYQQVRLQRWTGIAWVNVTTKSLTAPSYAFALPTRVPGSTRYRVVKLARGGYAQRISGAHTLTVVR